MSCTCLASACWHSSRGPSCSSVCMWSSATHHACILASTTKQNLPTHHMPTTYVAHPPLPPPHGNTYMHTYNGPVFCSLKIGTCSVAGLLCFCNLLGIMLPCPALFCSVSSTATGQPSLLAHKCMCWLVHNKGWLPVRVPTHSWQPPKPDILHPSCIFPHCLPCCSTYSPSRPPRHGSMPVPSMCCWCAHPHASAAAPVQGMMCACWARQRQHLT